jgi:hypothetical protein
MLRGVDVEYKKILQNKTTTDLFRQLFISFFQ